MAAPRDEGTSSADELESKRESKFYVTLEVWGSYGARIPWYRSSQMRRSFGRCPSPSRMVVRWLRRPGRCRRGGPRGCLEVENGDAFDTSSSQMLSARVVRCAGSLQQ